MRAIKERKSKKKCSLKRTLSVKHKAREKRAKDDNEEQSSSHQMQPVEEHMNIELFHRTTRLTVRFETQIREVEEKEVTCLRKNIDVFIFKKSYLIEKNLEMALHYLNIEP